MSEGGQLTIYVTKGTDGFVGAQECLSAIQTDALVAGWTSQIVDVATKPEIAAEDRVLLTPTIVMRLGAWEGRLIGSLDDTTAVIAAAHAQLGLALEAVANTHPAGKARE